MDEQKSKMTNKAAREEKMKCVVHGVRHRGYTENMACKRAQAHGIPFAQAKQEIEGPYNPYEAGLFSSK